MDAPESLAVVDLRAQPCGTAVVSLPNDVDARMDDVTLLQGGT
jgi:hypothetical protein